MIFSCLDGSENRVSETLQLVSRLRKFYAVSRPPTERHLGCKAQAVVARKLSPDLRRRRHVPVRCGWRESLGRVIPCRYSGKEVE